MGRRRVVLLADTSRAQVAEVIDEVRAVLAAHVEVALELPDDDRPLPDDLDVDLAVAVGGDGTLINEARRLVDRGLPLIGVNVGRLGFLAEFDAATLAEQASVIFGPDPPITRHMVLAGRVRDAAGNVVHDHLAVNDFVISAGPPFRMIELRLSIDGAKGPRFSGDGIIIATPIGSTAYNVSAGGPIVHPELEAMVITPLAAHTLAFRPILVRATSMLHIEMLCTNAGTALVRDGSVIADLAAGSTIELRRHAREAAFVNNPETTYWRILQDKLRWGAPPTYRVEVND